MTEKDFYRVLTEVTAAKTYLDVFMPVAVDEDAALAELKKAYRARVVHIHPDRVEAWNKQVATDTFQRLTAMYNEATDAVLHKTIGRTRQNVTFVTSVASHALRLEQNEWSDMAACYEAETSLAGTTRKSFVKCARAPIDNDLIGAEAAAIRKLYDGGDPKRTMYYPHLLDTFGAELNGVKVRANTFAYLEGFVNLEEVKRARPGGLDPLDAAWMWRRLLWALDYAHNKGIVHGAVLPQNVMILPAQHGLVLVDWAYSVQQRGAAYAPLKAIVGKYREWYPAEVRTAKQVSPATDVVMAARTLTYLMGGDPLSGELPVGIPEKMRVYFKEMVAKGARDVPTAAQRYEGLLQQLGRPYYPRTFRPFVL